MVSFACFLCLKCGHKTNQCPKDKTERSKSKSIGTIVKGKKMVWKQKRTNQSNNQVGIVEKKNAHNQEGDKINEGLKGSNVSENKKKDALDQEGAKKNDGGTMSNV